MEPKLCHRCGLDNYGGDDFLEIEVCTHCGFVQNSTADKIEKKFTHHSLGAIAAAILVLALLVVHTAKWGQFFFAAIPIQAKALAGLASNKDYSELATMCHFLKKYDCVEDALIEKVESSPDDIGALSELGVLQFQRRNFKASAEHLRQYVEAGGKDIYSHYIFAKALSEVGEIDLAADSYARILASKPDMLQVTVAKNYVEMLIKNGREKEARQVISSIRRKGQNTSDFMKAEMRAYALK